MNFLVSLLVSFAIAVLGAALVFFSTSDGKKIAFGILTVIYTFLAWLIVYCGMPSVAYPLLGWYGGALVLFWVISAVVTGMMDYDYEAKWSHSYWFPIVGLLLIMIVSMSGCNALHDSHYAGLIGKITDKSKKHWAQDIQPIDPKHIRLVPTELAVTLAKTALSDEGSTLGSQFPMSEEYATLQKIGSDYWYLIPLDFNGYKVWTNADYVPAYVKVLATDPYSQPILVKGKKMKYTPGAYFDDDLERILYAKYYDKVLMDYSFEEDEQGNVFWVVSVCSPTVTYFGLTVEGVVIFDPETGEQEYVSQKAIEENPKYAWVDRVMPSQIVESYVNYWGDLKDGWWNSFWDHVNLLEAETPTVNYSSDGRCVFVTPITSTNESDHAMTGLMYTDARTGESIYYTTSGGATEQALVDAVNSAVQFKSWHGSAQIVYENIAGELAALVPIMGPNGNYQGLAVVETINKRVAIGVTPQEAMIEFQKVLMSGSGQITTDATKVHKDFTGRIQRIGWDISTTGKQYYIYFSSFRNSFMVSSGVQSELALTKEGDEVFISYVASNQSAVPVMQFKNITLALALSDKEKYVLEQTQKRQDLRHEKSDVKDFKEELKNMSDEEVKKLMDGKNK